MLDWIDWTRWQHRTNPREKFSAPPEEPKPEYGTVRIVPYGSSGFAVERYEVSDTRSRSRCGPSWRQKFEGTEEDCEAEAKRMLRAAANEAERIRLQNEAVAKHHAAHPPRVITLDQ